MTTSLEYDSIVMAGGGAKGLAYLGAFEELEATSPGFLKKLRSAGGSSAGAIAALYLALGLNISDIRRFLNTDFLMLLDDGVPLKHPKLKVQTNAREVVTDVMHLFDFATACIRQNPDNAEFCDKILHQLSVYFSEVIGDVVGSMVGGGAKGEIVRILVDKFTPLGPLHKLVSTFVDPLTPPTTDQASRVVSDLVSNLGNASKGYEISATDASHEPRKTDASPANIPVDITPERYPGGLFNRHSPAEFTFYDSVRATSAMIQHLISPPPSDWKYGLFSGDKIVDALILAPIQKATGLDATAARTITFYELFDKTQKILRVTAYNPVFEKTDVFSSTTTPDAVVADAVRASMSIPVFFEPKLINARKGDAVVPISYVEPETNTARPVPFMDGGTLDNYPMWIFDHPEFDSAQNGIAVYNTKTLGLRLCSTEDVERFTNPPTRTVGGAQLPLAPRNHVVRGDGNFYLKTVMGSFLNAGQKNAFVHSHDIHRTALVDNLGVGALALSMSDKQKALLIKSGADGIRKFLQRKRPTAS